MRLRHLRGTCDVRTKVFGEAHPTVRGPKLHYHLLESYCSKIHTPQKMELGSPHQWMRLGESFSYVVLDPCRVVLVT